MAETVKTFPVAFDRLLITYNLLRDALVWFDAHDVQNKLAHVPQWVVSARAELERTPL